jgi:hypothetical protein
LSHPSLQRASLLVTLFIATGALADSQSSAAGLQAPFDVDSIIRRVHFAYRAEQDGWRGGHSTYDVKATVQGLILTPVHYRSPEQEPPAQPGSPARAPLDPEVEKGTPLFLGPAQVTRGDLRLSQQTPRGQVAKDGHLTFQHPALVEHLRNSEQGVEQSWSFETQPGGKGDLWVRVPVKGLVHTRTSEQGLHFSDARTGLGFRYGHGTWVDGKGRRTPVPARYSDGQIQLRVPQAVLAASSYPAVLDPIISSELIVDGRLAPPDTTMRRAVALAFNGTNYLVVWEQKRSGASIIYGTRVNTSGSLLDLSGIAIGIGPGSHGSPTVASNGTDFYVAWHQRTWDTLRILGTRVDASGVVTHPGGVVLSPSVNEQHRPRVASNGTDYLVAWMQSTSSGSSDVNARRVSSTGQVLDTSDIAIATSSSYEQLPSVASNGTVYLVVWSDDRSSVTRVYATRVSAAGAVLDGTGFPLSGSSTQTYAAVASNGTDFLAVWRDRRNSVVGDLYGTRITGAGTVVDGSGLVISEDPNAVIATDNPAVGSNGTNYLVAWNSRSSSANGQIRASRVSASASSASAVLDPSGIALSATVNNYGYPALSSPGLSYLVAWEGNDPLIGGRELYSIIVSASGTKLLTGGLPITAPVFALHQTEPEVASNGSNYLVVWTETTNAGVQIYGARVTPWGAPIDVSPLVITSSIRERQTPRVASNGTDYFVAWADYRNINWDIYGSRVLGSGSSASAVVDPGGIAISAHTAFENEPAVASNGTDYLVTWRRDPSSRADVYGARVTSGGVVQDTSGIAIATNTVEHYAPRVASNGSNYLVVWTELRSLTGADIYGARVSTAGAVLDTSGIAISALSQDEAEPAVGSNGTDYFVAWTDYSSGSDTQIYGARVSGAGVVQDTPALALCTQTTNQYMPRVSHDGTNYVAAWADYRAGSFWNIYVTQVTGSGTVVTAGGSALNGGGGQTAPHFSLASAGGQQSFVVYSRTDPDPTQADIRTRGKFFGF